MDINAIFAAEVVLRAEVNAYEIAAKIEKDPKHLKRLKRHGKIINKARKILSKQVKAVQAYNKINPGDN